MGLGPVGSNPVLTAADVTDYGKANGVADPFLFVEDHTWHLFFEVYNHSRDPTAVIGHATSETSGCTWQYDGVVLETDLHLSFPYVFEHENDYYMVPDAWSKSHASAPVCLYRADSFTNEWQEVTTVVRPQRPIHDCILFQHDGRWWALAGEDGNLFAYSSRRLEESHWQPHASNPVIEGRERAARPGGRPFVTEDALFVYFQDCSKNYGRKVRLYEITSLSPDIYNDREVEGSPVLEPASATLGWNGGKMHHIDYRAVDGRWRCVVDGNIGIGRTFFGNNWSIGVFDAPI